MCLNADDVNPLCDECFAKYKAGKLIEDKDMCKECRDLMKRYCWCCMVEYEIEQEAGIIDGLCKKCRDGN